MTTNTCWHETLLVGKFPWNKHLMGDFPAKHLWFSRYPKKPWFCVGSTHFGDLIWEGLNILWRNGLTSMFSIVFAYYPDLVVKPRYPFFLLLGSILPESKLTKIKPCSPTLQGLPNLKVILAVKSSSLLLKSPNPRVTRVVSILKWSNLDDWGYPHVRKPPYGYVSQV